MSSGPGEMGSAHDNHDSPRRLRSNMVHDQADNWVYVAPDAPTRHECTPFLQNIDNDALEAITIGMGGLMDDEMDEELMESDDEEEENAQEDDDSDAPPPSEGEDEEPEEEEEFQKELGPLKRIREQFYNYVERIKKEQKSFLEEEKTAIKLLHLLKRKGAPLNTYQEVMEWHLKESDKMEHYQQMKDCRTYISRDVMMDRLRQRYNMGNKYPYRKKIKLPVSGSVVRMTLHSPAAVIQSLLTDPRIKDDEYCFFDDNPLAPPPERVTNIGELMTAYGYRTTHKKRVDKDPEKRQQLLPVPLYIDGSAVSHFHNMEVIPSRCH